MKFIKGQQWICGLTTGNYYHEGDTVIIEEVESKDRFYYSILETRYSGACDSGSSFARNLRAKKEITYEIY